MTKVAVVILNWNGKKFLEQFLPSVIEHSFNDAEIYVADNASTDDSVTFLRQNFPTVKIITQEKNDGFAGGYNQALKQVAAEYYVLLNSDVEVTPNWIRPVIEQMDQDAWVAASQPKIKDYNNKDFFEYAGAAGGIMDDMGYAFCRGRIFNTLEKDKGQYDQTTEVFWATGACLFIRSSIFHGFGGFDEDFFAHMEEIDLCWRIKNGGYKIMYYPQSTVYHVGGGTLPKSNPHKTFLNFRNNLFILYKNLPQGKLFSTLSFRLCLDGVAGLKFLLEGHVKDFLAVIRAHRYFFGHLSVLKQKRKWLTQQSLHPNHKSVYKKMIIVDYFLKGKKTYQQLN